MNKTILNKINCLKLSMSFSVYFKDKGENNIGEVEKEGRGRENREQRWGVDGEEQGWKVERTKKGGR